MLTLRKLLLGGLALLNTCNVVKAEVWGHKLAQVQRLQAQAATQEARRHHPPENTTTDDYQYLTKDTYRKSPASG